MEIKIPADLIQSILDFQAGNSSCQVRISSIPEKYDISNDFEAYADYVSEPIDLQLHRGTTSFSEKRRLFPDWAKSSSPVLKSDDRGFLYLAWLEEIDSLSQLLFSHSKDGGETWSQVLNLSRDASSILEFDLAVDGLDRVFLIWNGTETDGTGTNRSFTKLCRSLNNGLSWEESTTLNEPDESADHADIEVDERGDVRVVWMTEQPYTVKLSLLHSRNHGTNWTRETLDVPSTNTIENDLALASGPQGRQALIAGGTCYHSADNGLSWNEETIPADNRELTTASFSNQGQLFVSWGHSHFGGHTLFNSNSFLKRNADGSWGEVQRLDTGLVTTSEQTALTHYTGSVDVVLTAMGDLVLLRSHDSGDHWDIPEIVPSSTGNKSYNHHANTARLPSGDTRMIYLHNDNPIQGTSYQLYLISFK